MGKNYEGKLIATGKRFAIVVSRFNEFITKRLLEGAIDALVRHGADEKDIDIFWVPGSFEIPMVVKKIALLKKHDAIIPLGVIIEGDTPHFQFIATEVTKGIAQIMLETGVPVAYGILTTNTIEQAIERAGTKEGNKGFQAALAAIELANLVEQI